MPFDNVDLPEFCTNLEEKDVFDNLIYIWVVPMGILVLCNLCGCRILTVNSFILFFIIYSGGIFAAIFFIQCGCCNVMPYFMSIPWSMTIAAWLLSWWGCYRLALRIDRFFDAKDGESVLNHEDTHQKFLNLWSGKPKIEVGISCYNMEHRRKWEWVYNSISKQYEYEYVYTSERINVFSTKECLNFSRYESEEIPELTNKKKMFRVKINFEVEIGDEVLEANLEKLKNDLIQKHASKALYHDIEVIKRIGDKVEGVSEDFLLREMKEEKKWYMQKLLLFALGFFHLLWMVTCFMEVAISQEKVIIKKKVFASNNIL